MVPAILNSALSDTEGLTVSVLAALEVIFSDKGHTDTIMV